MGGYVVAAGFVTVETAVPGGRAGVDIPAGQVLPSDVPQETVANLLALGHIVPAVPVSPAVPQQAVTVDEVPTGTIADITAWVGDDPGRARRALDVEQGKGDKARSTLVDALTGLAGQ